MVITYVEVHNRSSCWVCREDFFTGLLKKLGSKYYLCLMGILILLLWHTDASPILISGSTVIMEEWPVKTIQSTQMGG